LQVGPVGGWLGGVRAALALAGLVVATPSLAVLAVSKEFVDPVSVTVGNLQSTTGQIANNTPAQGDVRTVRIGISQVGAAISSGTLTDVLPAQIRLANPVNARFSADCGVGATVGTGAPGGGTLSAVDVAVPAGTNAVPGRCFVYFDVVSTQVGNWINQIAIGGVTGNEAGVGPISNADPAPRNLTVTALAALGVTKSFAPSPVIMGQLTTLTIQITNPNAGRSVALTQLTENLPANLAAENTTPVAACSAGGTAGTAGASGTAGSVTIAFSGTVVAGGGTCTLAWSMRGVVQNGTNVGGTNTIPANSLVNSRGLNSAVASAAITVQSPITHTKSFSPNPARAGEPKTLTIDVVNRSAAAVTGVGWTDTLPSDMLIGAVPTANAACAGATVTGAVGTNVVTLAGATVAAGATCRVTVSVVGNTVQTYNNSTGGASWTQGGNSAVTNPANASVAVFSGFRAFKSILDRNGQPFNGAVAPGDTLRFRIELENFADGQINGVTVIDPLPAAGGAQIVYATAATPGAANPRTSCTPNANAQQAGPIAAPTTAQTDGAATVTFSGLVVPGNPDGNAAAATRCFLEFDAVVPRSWPVGTQISNNIPAGNVSGPGGLQAQNTIVANIPTITQFQLFKSFAPATLSAGESTVVTLTLVNSGFFALTGVELDDPLPAPLVSGIAAQMRVADPASFATSCAGTPVVTLGAARERLQVSGLTVPARASGALDSRCTVSFRVRAPIPTTYTNVASAPAATDARTGTAIPPPAPASAVLIATPSLTAAKAFAPSPVSASGGVSTVTVTLNNIGTGLLTGVGVNDPLPAALRVASPANASTTCGGPTAITATPGAASAQLAGARVPAGTSCTFKFDVVTSGAANPVTNSIPPGGVFADGGVITTTATSANLATFAGGEVNVQKGFAPTDLQAPGQPTRLTLTLANVSTQALTGLAVTDELPAGMVVTATPNAVTTCGGGVVEAVAGSDRVRLSGGSLPAGNGSFPTPPAATCTVAVDVTLRRTGTVFNTVLPGAVTSDQALTNSDQAVANVTALATVGVTKRFEPIAVTPGTPSRLVLTVLNSAGIDFNNLQVVDPLPAGLAVAVPAGASTTCGSGTVATRPSLLGGGRTDVVLTGGTLAGAIGNTTSCEIAIDVVASAQAAYLNTVPVGNVTADDGVSNTAPASATLNVRAAATVTKAFAQLNRRINEENRLTLTITNPNPVPLTNVSLTDTYPANVFNSASPDAATNCAGGVVSAAPSGSQVRLNSATVPANGSCTVSVDVLANVVGSWTNTVPDGALSSAEGITNPAPASATFVTLDPPTLGKEFRPVQIAAGGVSQLRIVLLNTNSIALTLSAALTDVLPAGLALGAPALDTTTADPQGRPRCAGVTTSGGNTITLASGASIPAGGCSIWANVTGSVAGQYLNAIAAGALATNAGPNALPATATLSISTQGSISGTVYRDSDNNGTIGSADIGLPGQTIELLDGGGNVIATTITDALGNYAFVDLPPGTYSVRQPQQPADTLNGTTSAPTGATAGGTASTPTAAPSLISGIVLGGGQNAQGANFGELLPAAVGGRVFRDNNNDGTAQAGDPPLSGVTITLTGTNDLGQPVSLSTTTDANGEYRFEGLRPGTYTLTEPTQPPGTGNGITRSGTGTSNAGTASAPTTLPSTVSGIVLAPGQRGAGFDFAEVALASISGTVYVDRDRNNGFNPTDVGRIPGVTLRLVQGADCASGTTLATTTTDAAGNYRFDNVAAGGSYLVCQTQPPGYGNGNAGGTAGSNVIVITNLPAGGLGGNNFGELGASLAGGVYLDADNDGVRDAGEAGIGGVQVTLSGTDVAGNPVTRSTVTDSAGNYRFDDLAQGTYTITEQPAQPVVGGVTTLDGRSAAGSIGGSTVGSATPVTTSPSAISAIALPAGADGINYNFGEILPVSLSGTVFFDNNANGTQNPARPASPARRSRSPAPTISARASTATWSPTAAATSASPTCGPVPTR
jgi:large repetitive protein